MAGLAMMGIGAVVNALAFSGSNFLFSTLRGSDEERKRHDLAVETMQKAQIAWAEKRQKRIDYINNEIRKENLSEKRFNDLGLAMKRYYVLTGTKLPELPPEPKLSDFYKPSESQKYRELGFIVASMTMVGGGIYWYEKRKK